ncbi:MAG TPA: hypothetical protein VF792_04620 [Ktedonobacterales bacterium]
MSMMLYADTTPLATAIASGDEARVISETLKLLGQRNLKPAKVGGRVGIDALWGDASPRALGVLGVSGRIADWMRALPLGPEPAEEDRRRLASATPLVQGFMATKDAVKAGMAASQNLPEPIEPMEIPGGKSVHEAIAEAFAAHDVTTMQRVLLGLNATGADYRSVLEALYVAIRFRFVGAGAPLTSIVAASEIMDMAEWGGRFPAFISWATKALADTSPNGAIGEAAKAYASDPAHDLSWMRTRISMAKEEAAGPAYQQALRKGDANAACDATLAALKAGATPRGIVSGMALSVADYINAIPQGDSAALTAAGQTLLYTHAVATVMRQTQHHDVWPMLYTAAVAVNALGQAAGAGALHASTSMPVSGGLIGSTLIRTLEQSAAAGDTPGALAAARRFMQLENTPRAVAGALGMVAARSDASGAGSDVSVAQVVAAAAEEYLALHPTLASGGQSALLAAGVRLASELRGDHSLADRVDSAIENALRTGANQN